MAQVTVNIGSAVINPIPAAVAPGVSEVVTAPGPGVSAEVIVGATATTITLPRPGDPFPSGDPKPSRVVGPLTSVTVLIPIGREFADPNTGSATVQFSQVAGVTWVIKRRGI